MARKATSTQNTLCVNNRGYRASLVVRRLYEILPDPKAKEHRLLRIIDESGEDHLCPARMFVALELPQPVKKAIACARWRPRRFMAGRPARTEAQQADHRCLRVKPASLIRRPMPNERNRYPENALT